jgi:hypothetical protein
VMKFRRLMGFPSGRGLDYTLPHRSMNTALCITAKFTDNDRCGSRTTDLQCPRNVCFASDSDRTAPLRPTQLARPVD